MPTAIRSRPLHSPFSRMSSGVSDAEEVDDCRIADEHRESDAEQDLREQHRLVALAGRALRLREFLGPQAGGAGGEGVAHLRTIVGDKLHQGAELAQLSDADAV